MSNVRKHFLSQAYEGAMATVEKFETKEGELAGGGWSPGGYRITFHNEADWKCFQALVNRAMNCWDRAPAKVKAFGDIITEGKVLQNYQDLGSEVKQP